MKLPLLAAVLLGLPVISGPAGGQEVPAPAPSAETLQQIREAVRLLADDPAVRSGTAGFYLASMARPAEPLLELDSGKSFITASTMKTLTTGSALEILGPEFRFETTLEYAAATGDLIIRGAGDPSLGRPGWEPLFNSWTLALRAAGITEIPGRIIADETAWEDQEIPDGWTWLDIGNYYAPPLTPLCFRDNSFRLYFSLDGQPGEPAGFYDADPWPDGLDIIDRVRLGRPGTGDNAYLFGGPGTTAYILRGTIAPDVSRPYIRGALPDPALFCAQEFTRWLNARQLPVHGRPLTTRQLSARADPPDLLPPAEARVTLATHSSRPLRELLIPINHQSLNLDCECLLRTLGKGRAATGLRVIRNHLASKNLPMEGYEQADGSGLSRTNMVTPALLARANATFLSGPYAAAYLDSLPELGTGGSTLRQLSAAGPAVIHAKSGTIERVKAYTGLVTPAGPAAPPFIFSILVNNYDGSFNQSVGPRLDELFEALSRL